MFASKGNKTLLKKGVFSYRKEFAHRGTNSFQQELPANKKGGEMKMTEFPPQTSVHINLKCVTVTTINILNIVIF